MQSATADNIYITIPANDNQTGCASFTRREMREFATPLFIILAISMIFLLGGIIFLFIKH